VSGAPPCPPFHVVDIPGTGYARRSGAVQRGWLHMLESFFSHRKSLRLVFFLLDSRHETLQSGDRQCLQSLRLLPPRVTLVTVFTKVDKLQKSDFSHAAKLGAIAQRGGGGEGSVRLRNLAGQVQAVLGENRTNDYSLFTSSTQKIGGISLWPHIIDALYS
jgi:hypothetical protein